ncbi:hypothetical protein OAA90_03465 [Salibacteraceae bacterium]|nr:hypothetical protein [Crocinitomicaceae bacterium]MDA9967897.1 hypothetical protein [Salibacteraceae bacterium]MDB9725423.1 hypothetical protein [Salibacteraceae bacterium]|tara:strand:+ start:43856 stop:44167 length:312 start_codon:yes stop_codon:yes gene_type:complete
MSEQFSNITDEDLLKEKGKIQYNKTVNATLIGFCVGIFIFSAVNNGFGFFTFFPLLLTYPFIKNGQKIKALSLELARRKLYNLHTVLRESGNLQIEKCILIFH